ncbi:MAG TPA: cytochrome d ubiquinol oxidase subunit II [Thermomicrobiales bacterium]|nr:cytochrome d ubiquinol oxidase subunit II [Thermomicrobiales bacterium]HRA46842.1 cytochrome d ubiquinol oxidase subunit II [Thermomicrobiales bacterium]
MPWSDVTIDLAFAAGGLLLLGVILYALLAGADFGGGIWDLLARGPRADRQRQEIARAIGPIWEANHVWLIFTIVVAFSAFPDVYAGLSTALFIPLSLILVGIVLRGAAFVFRAYAHDVVQAQQAWGAVFAIASVGTPFLLGMCAGAIATGEIRIVDGEVQSSLWSTWLAPFPIVVGLVSLATCAFLAAVYLTNDVRGQIDLAEDFRIRALGAGIAAIGLALVALVLARSQAPVIWHGMTDRDVWTVIPLGVALAVLSGWAVWNRHYPLARVSAAAEVIVLIVGWALAQYPYLVVPDLTYQNAAASDAMLKVSLIAFGIGSLLLIPSLALLFALFKGRNPAITGEYGGSTSELT